MTGADTMREDARRRAEESALAQGLPAKVEEPSVLGLVADLLRSHRSTGGAA